MTEYRSGQVQLINFFRFLFCWAYSKVMQTGQPQEARSEQTDEQENRAEGEETQEEETDPVKYMVINLYVS